MSITECDLIRGVTYKRYHYDPSTFKYTIPYLVLIHRTSRRNINENEIVVISIIPPYQVGPLSKYYHISLEFITYLYLVPQKKL